MGKLLLRGMLVGLVAGVLTFAFLKVFGEPQVERAIAVEAQVEAAGSKAGVDAADSGARPAPVGHGAAHDDAGQDGAGQDAEELVSRPTQAGIGLFTGVAVYCTAFGGLFALVFALVYGRLGELGPRGTSAVLAVLGMVSVSVVPGLKYPANPPAVGDPGTIGLRTALFFALIAISLAATIGAALLRNRLVPKVGGWNATLWAGAAYLVAMAAVAAAMPGVDEVPDSFPATTLWAFRIDALGAQAILWTTLGVLFGTLTHRVASRRGMVRLDAAVL